MAKGFNIFARGWRNIREAGPRRLVITAMLLGVALLIARYSWFVPVTAEAERALFDSRSYLLAEEVEQDDRIVLVVYNEQTLINAYKRSPLDRGILANALANIDTLGAKSIGIDILFDQPQLEDQLLVDTLRSMDTPVRIGYASQKSNKDDIIYEQQEYLEEFLGALEGSNSGPTSIRLDNSRGVTRNWPTIEPDILPVLGRSMLTAAGDGDLILPGYEGTIRYRNPAFEKEPVFLTLPIDLFTDPETLPYVRDQIEGRYVMIGGDLLDVDRVNTPFTGPTGETMAGLRVHAHMVAQMLDGNDMPKPLTITLWAMAVMVVMSAVLSGLLEWRNWRIYPLMAAQFILLLGVPVILHRNGADTFGLPAVGWIVSWILAFMAITSAARAAGAVQRNFAQGALGKYLPREMADEILERPELLSLHGEKKEIFVMFSDLEGFTKMSHAMEPEMVAKLLNRYLELLSDVVLDHGGVIDKFVGDAVVAFWGAPIQRDDDGERAARAGYAVWQAGETFRKEVAEMDENLPKIGKTRVGLHWGEAVVGNFGGDTRIQYTALGDSMNTAARLEAANKALETSVMASSEFAEKTGLDWWRPMGRIQLRGRAKPVDIMEPAPDFPKDDTAQLAKACGLAESDPAAAQAIVKDLITKHSNAVEFVNLLSRMKNLNEGGTYVLG